MKTQKTHFVLISSLVLGLMGGEILFSATAEASNSLEYRLLYQKRGIDRSLDLLQTRGESVTKTSTFELPGLPVMQMNYKNRLREAFRRELKEGGVEYLNSGSDTSQIMKNSAEQKSAVTKPVLEGTRTGRAKALLFRKLR